MADYTIYDNLLHDQDFLKIKSIFMGNEFPWFYQDHIVTGDRFNGQYQFTHNILRDGVSSPYIDTVGPILSAIGAKELYRIKANLKGRTESQEEGGWHTDFPPEELICMTGVFYLNTNNGYTTFKDGSIVESIENRFVAFKSDQLHSGVSHTDTKVRCVININYDV